MAITWSSMSNVFVPSTDLHGSYNIASNTNVRDVSDILDGMHLSETPLLNRIGYGDPATATTIEWLTEQLGYMYVVLSNGGAVASNASAAVFGTSGLGAISTAMRQIHTGTLLMAADSGVAGAETGSAAVMAIEDWSLGGSCAMQWLSGMKASITDATTFFIIGSPVNEGSEPRRDQTRPRAIASNKMQIFRQDVRLTGTAKAVKMYSVNNEWAHQIMLHTRELKREQERTLLYGVKEARAAGEPGLMGGIFYFLNTVDTTFTDSTTTTITQPSLETQIGEMWDYGGFDTDYAGNTTPIIMGHRTQIAKITGWDADKIRMSPDDYVVGQWTTKYMSTEIGREFELLVNRWCRPSDLFIINPAKLKMRPMTGRQLIAEELGRKGDYTEWQLISECSCEIRGYGFGAHGLFRSLT